MDKVLKEVSDIYHKNLLKSPIALNYLIQERGITLSSISKYNIGYASGNLITKMYRKNNKLDKVTSIKIVKNQKDFFNNYLTFPIVKDGEVLSMYGRAINASITHICLEDTSKSILYNRDALSANKIILVESPIDAISLEQLGFNSIAVCSSVLPSGSAPIFKDKNVYVWFDNDDAGTYGADKTIRELILYTKNVYKLSWATSWAEKMDANSYILQSKLDPSEAIRYRIKNSVAIFKSPIPVKRKKIKKYNEDEIPITRVGKKLFKDYVNSGDSIWVRCPHHNLGLETKRSLWIGGKKNMFYCFGCHKGGGPVYLVAWHLGISSDKASEWIKENF